MKKVPRKRRSSGAGDEHTPENWLDNLPPSPDQLPASDDTLKEFLAEEGMPPEHVGSALLLLRRGQALGGIERATEASERFKREESLRPLIEEAARCAMAAVGALGTLERLAGEIERRRRGHTASETSWDAQVNLALQALAPVCLGLDELRREARRPASRPQGTAARAGAIALKRGGFSHNQIAKALKLQRVVQQSYDGENVRDLLRKRPGKK